MRLCDRLDVDQETAAQTYFLCLLFYVGCHAPADVGMEIFGSDDALATYGAPVRFGSRTEVVRGRMRAVAPPVGSWPLRTWQLARHLPALALGFPSVVAATCEVARMLTDRLGLGSTVSRLVRFEDERWDGKGLPDGVGETEIPLPVRIVHVARDAAFQGLLGDDEFVAEVIGRRAGAPFDPTIGSCLRGSCSAYSRVRPTTGQISAGSASAARRLRDGVDDLDLTPAGSGLLTVSRFRPGTR
jgi:hypothetical protein